jgi:hypothetical protein
MHAHDGWPDTSIAHPVDRRTFCRGAALAGLALVTGCGDGAGGGPRPRRGTGPTEAERRFGTAPRDGGSIRYQPEVVRVAAGAAAIRAMGSDGLTWVLDAGSAGAERIRPGAVLLVTERCAGRVLAMGRTGGEVIVLLGPAELTDFIRDCDLDLEQPVGFGDGIAYPAPGLPGTELALTPVAPFSDSPAEDEFPEAGPASSRGPPGHGSVRVLRAAQQTLPLHLGVRPEVGPGGIGIRTAASNGHVNIEFVAKLRLAAPRLHLRLRIGAGRIREATLRFSGAAGLRLGFVATSTGNYTANINSQGRLVPVDLVIPILLDFGSPLALAIQQRFLVQSAFSARQSVLRAIGDYTLQGDLHFGYSGGGFGAVGGPTIHTVNDGLIQGMRSISVGVSGMVLAHQVRIMAGIGAAGFRVGPYVAMTSSVGVSHGSLLAAPLQPNVCRAATLALTVAPGLGWQVPQLIVDGVNAILGLLRVRRIQNSGGINGQSVRVFDRTAYMPTTDLCREAAGGGGAGDPGSAAPPGGGGGGPPPPDPSPPRQPAPAPDPRAEEPAGVDLAAACRDPELRRRLQEAGLDVERICGPLRQRV